MSKDNTFNFGPLKEAFEREFNQCVHPYNECIIPVEEDCHKEAMGNDSELPARIYNPRKAECLDRDENVDFVAGCEEYYPTSECKEAARFQHGEEILDWLNFIDIYSAISWDRQTLIDLDPVKIDGQLSVRDMKTVDFDRDGQFTEKDARTLAGRLKKASFQLKGHGITLSYPTAISTTFLEDFRNFLKSKAPAFYKKAFPKG